MHQGGHRRKKLRGAVRHDFHADGADRFVVDAELQADCGQLGIDLNRLMPPARQKDKPEDYELSPELWDAWEVFKACGTQWRISVGFTAVRYEGIEFTSLETAVRLLGIPRKKQRGVFWMVRVLQDEALKFLNKP